MSGRTVVGIASLAVKKCDSGLLVTHALGSCVGVTIYDPVTHVGGLLHFMLPSVPSGQDLAPDNYMYCSTAVPAMFRMAYELGAQKQRLVVCCAGASEMIEAAGAVRIGQRNRTLLRKLLWKNHVVLSGEDTGGNVARTMSLDLGTGSVTVTAGGTETTLWKKGQS